MNSKGQDNEKETLKEESRPSEKVSGDSKSETVKDTLSDLPGRDTHAETRQVEPGDVPQTSLVQQISVEEHSEFGLWDQVTEAGQGADQFENVDALRMYNNATAQVLESIRRAKGGDLPDLEPMARLVDEMAESIESSSALVLLGTDRGQEFSVSTHCVNVSILVQRVTIGLESGRKERVRLGLAGLLHEVGVVRLDEKVLHQPGKGVPELRRRPLFSGEILRGLGPGFDWLVQTVEQVYEREDGSGFPKGLTGKDICEEAKILGIADVLEACIHSRPDREALTGYELFHELTTRENRSFPDPLVRALLNSFSLYPYNEYVILNTGEIGQVVEVNSKNLMRPRVKILYDNQGCRLEEKREVDLEKTPSQNITEAIPPSSLPLNS